LRKMQIQIPAIVKHLKGDSASRDAQGESPGTVCGLRCGERIDSVDQP
jgi:hypothetical protein